MKTAYSIMRLLGLVGLVFFAVVGVESWSASVGLKPYVGLSENAFFINAGGFVIVMLALSFGAAWLESKKKKKNG